VKTILLLLHRIFKTRTWKQHLIVESLKKSLNLQMKHVGIIHNLDKHEYKTL